LICAGIPTLQIEPDHERRQVRSNGLVFASHRPGVAATQPAKATPFAGGNGTTSEKAP
jgi:hypothetical protein